MTDHVICYPLYLPKSIQSAILPTLMTSPPTHSRPPIPQRGFTLIEIAAVIAVLVTLITVSLSLLNNTGTYSRRTATQLLTSLVAQARTYAITSHCEVALAFAEPTDLPSSAGRYQLGLFKLTTPLTPAAQVSGNLIQRWESMNSGIVLFAEDLVGLPNLMDQVKLQITSGGTKNSVLRVHALIFDPRGKLCFPPGSSPLVLRLAEGRYQDGLAIPTRRAGSANITENRLKIGRLSARIYPFD